MDTKPTAKVVCDSISPHGHRLTTLEITMHRFVLAEFNTHRGLSRNAASSRAVPVEKLMERVEKNPAMPVWWGKNQAGMQANEELEDTVKEDCKNVWLSIRNKCIDGARFMLNSKLHKQLTNRLIEPWMWTTDIATGTEEAWANFFYQRCHPAAQPEMRACADAIQLAYFSSTPKKLEYREWHLPYITEEDINEFHLYYERLNTREQQIFAIQDLKKISAARCARVSYLNHDGSSPKKSTDLEMFEKLSTGDPMHPSLLEHIATPCTHMDLISNMNEILRPGSGLMMFGKSDSETYIQDNDLFVGCKRWGNLKGWHQFRKEFPRENITKFEPNHPELRRKDVK